MSNDIITNVGSSSTAGSTRFSANIVHAGLIASAILSMPAAPAQVPRDVQVNSRIQLYRLEGASSTYGQLTQSPFSSSYFIDTVSNDLYQAVGSLYSKLMEEQEPLGTEFEKVLHDNLWNLYVET